MRLASLMLIVALVGCRDSEADKDTEDFDPRDQTSDTDAPSDTEFDPDTVDADEDGVPASEDCDDEDASRYPGADEVCDDVDNDCDELVDAEDDDLLDGTTYYADADDDGYGDEEATTTACETPDGYTDEIGDCDDDERAVNPSAVEVCDGIDNDCDGTTDGADAVDAETYYADDDEDGFGDAEDTTADCALPSGYVENDEDCDDADDDVNPDGTELCDGTDDEDCDGTVDEDGAADGQTFYEDDDGDGFGDADDTYTSCSQPSGYVDNDEDCDDSAADVNPDSLEFCDGSQDEDCDGTVDEDSASDAATFYEDDDGDGYGDASDTTEACDTPSGYVDNDEDCDDGDSAISPDGTEVCDGSDDEDCDGTVDEDGASDAETFYADSDGDGFGDADTTYDACEAPTGYVADDEDCDDASATTNPDAEEYCDGSTDEDCDGTVDEADAVDAETFYADDDEDGYGDPDDSTEACEAPSGYLADDQDCDDGDDSINPDGTEVCDGSTDEDCDGTIDEDGADDALTWYADVDGDGYGDADSTTEACEEPSGYVDNDEDCHDDDADAYPESEATETPDDGVDQDCDGYDGCFDIDCDGLADLIIADYYDGNYSTSGYIYYSDGGYADADADTFDGEGSYDVKIADLDGDGYQDLVVANYYDGSSYNIDSFVYYGSSSGFSNSSRTDLPTKGAVEVEIGDLDNDGYDDLVFANYRGSSSDFTVDSYVYYGSSLGYSSSSRTDLPTRGARDVEIHDVNSDGYDDLVFCNQRGSSSDYTTSSYVYYGGSSGYSTSDVDSLSTSSCRDVEVEDIDGDGYAEIAFANYRNNSSDYTINSYVYYGTASGYSSSYRYDLPTDGALDVAFGDIDMDGTKDVVFTGYYANSWSNSAYTEIYYYSSGFSSSNRDSISSKGTRRALIEDLDADGYNDLVLVRYRNSSTQNTNSWVYYGSSSGYSSSDRDDLPTYGAYHVTAVDLDEDEFPELIFSNYYTGSSYQADDYIYWADSSGGGYSTADRDALSTYGTLAPIAVAGSEVGQETD